MQSRTSARALRAYVEETRVDAVARVGVPPRVAADAARATIKGLSGQSDDVRLRRRARGYFWAVVRRALARSRAAPEVSARFVLSTVAADLAAAGRSPAAVWNELVRGWSDKVPSEVLDEYRVRLCA